MLRGGAVASVFWVVAVRRHGRWSPHDDAVERGRHDELSRVQPHLGAREHARGAEVSLQQAIVHLQGGGAVGWWGGGAIGPWVCWWSGGVAGWRSCGAGR